jgi:hypothetical protein
MGAELAHLKLEDQRLQNAEIEKEWLNKFGVLYFDLLQADFTNSSLKRQVGLKKGNPEFTKEELILADREAQETDRKKIEQFENDLKISEIISMNFGNKRTDSKEKVDEEMLVKFKKALRTIWLKTHPDKLIDKLFSPQQIKKLHDFYQKATELSTSERLVNPRNLSRLSEIISEIDQIYKNMGINLPLNSTVQGITMKDKVHWLDNQIALLDNEISALKNEYYSLASNPEVKQKQESMLSPQVIESVKNQLTVKIAMMKAEQAELNKELNTLFGI